MSVISPLGNTLEGVWRRVVSGEGGIQRLGSDLQISAPFPFGGVASDFTGAIQDFGPLDPVRQKGIRKGLKLMCREIQMGVAAAQLALDHAGFVPGAWAPDRTGVVFGCDHVVAHPEEFIAAYAKCARADDHFPLGSWGDLGMPQITPLWLLKYLPNMPASHITIHNDLRGPNNSLTHREVCGGLAIAEGASTIRRGAADRMLVGATGSSLGPLRSLQASFAGEVVSDGEDPSTACRPFDRGRRGTVFGEGASALLLEERSSAEARGATIYGEILGWGASIVNDSRGTSDFHRGLTQAIQAALRHSSLTMDRIGHIHAQGLATRRGDAQEGAALREIGAASANPPPIVATKSLWGNMVSASGFAELIVSLLAIKQGRLFPATNFDDPDPECGVMLVRDGGVSAGNNVLKLSYTPFGQCAAVIVGRG